MRWLTEQWRRHAFKLSCFGLACLTWCHLKLAIGPQTLNVGLCLLDRVFSNLFECDRVRAVGLINDKRRGKVQEQAGEGAKCAVFHGYQAMTFCFDPLRAERNLLEVDNTFRGRQNRQHQLQVLGRVSSGFSGNLQ